MNKLRVIFLLLVLFSCTEENQKYEYYHLKRQLTPDQKNYIYQYGRYGPMAFSSDLTGTKMLAVSEQFAEKKGMDVGGTIAAWLSKDTLLVYDFKSKLEQPQDTLPIHIVFEKLGEITLKKAHYKVNAGSRAIYRFDSLSVGKDSLTVYGDFSAQNTVQLSFPLGPITVYEQADTLFLLQVNELYKSMDFVRKDENGNTLTGQPMISSMHYEFTPTSRIDPGTLGQVGIFRDVK